MLLKGRVHLRPHLQQLFFETARKRLVRLAHGHRLPAYAIRRHLLRFLEQDQEEAARPLLFAQDRTNAHANRLHLVAYAEGDAARLQVPLLLRGLVERGAQLQTQLRADEHQQVGRRLASLYLHEAPCALGHVQDVVIFVDDDGGRRVMLKQALVQLRVG